MIKQYLMLFLSTSIFILASVYTEIVEDIAGNANGIATTGTQLNSLGGISNALNIEYADVLLTASYVDKNAPTIEEIQSVIDRKMAMILIPIYRILLTNDKPIISNVPPSITCVPETKLYAYESYSFLPMATDTDTLIFSIQNKPDWAEFNVMTGELSGRPTVESNTSNINISVFDGQITVSLPLFSIEVLPAINLAHVYGKARQSSTYSNYPASHIIDGNLSSINHTWENAWLEIALPKGLKIAKVVVYNRKGSSASRLSGTKMYMGSEAYDGTVVNENMVSTLTANLIQTIAFTPPKEENFLLIKGTNYLHLREVAIYGERSESFLLNSAPKIIKHITDRTFTNDNRSFILKHDKNGTVTSNCGSLMPRNIIANLETNFIFTDIEFGTFKDCNVSVISAEGDTSNPAVLEEFTFFKVLNMNKLRGRSDGKGLDYVILADGFQEHEMSVFRSKAQEYADYILDYDDNLSLERKAWNIFTIETVSKESGADNVDGKDGTKVDTALDSYFWCGGTSRLLCINRSKASFVTAKYVPQFDKVLIITNSSKYGGAGGEYATTSLGGGANVVVHELGHSLAGLADEYTYGRINPPNDEPSQVNVTINNDIATVKWLHWLGMDAKTEGSIGLYEGGLYISEGVWRPTINSVMRSLGRPFYSVNAEAWALSVYRTAGVTYSHTPVSINISQVSGSNSNFTIEPSMGPNAQKIMWQVDDVNQTVADDKFTFIFGVNKNIDYNVKAIISDRTGVIRKDTSNYSTETIEWNVKVN